MVYITTNTHTRTHTHEHTHTHQHTHTHPYKHMFFFPLYHGLLQSIGISAQKFQFVSLKPNSVRAGGFAHCLLSKFFSLPQLHQIAREFCCRRWVPADLAYSIFLNVCMCVVCVYVCVYVCVVCVYVCVVCVYVCVYTCVYRCVYVCVCKCV